MTLRRFLTFARLTLKVQRFETLVAVAAALVLAVATLVVFSRLREVGVSETCLETWIAGGLNDPTCSASVQRWATINEGEAGMVMAAMAVLPPAFGLLVGVPLVGRELETRAAAMGWALSGSRQTWLAMRFVPAALLTIAIVGIPAVTASILVTERTGYGVWSSTFGDASLFGLPVVARAILALSIGLLAGAVLARTLPAFIVGAVVVTGIAFLISVAQSGYVPLPRSIPGMSIGQGPALERTIKDNPDILLRLVGDDGRLVTPDEALALVPPAASDRWSWIAERYQLVSLGVSPRRTGEWQIVESGAVVVAAVATIAAAAAVVERRRPM